ncbi:NAD-dependent epimerase/dehydratase family protein [Cohnella soli]|uniref:NAD-dependent epimerase/dehydratase family protein n=1 Tax=Cohnella soli TaxID=425005 RepID=A0ABW0HYS7_9BACL
MTRGVVVVTGAGGFTGAHACRVFAAKGWDVVALVSPRGLRAAEEAVRSASGSDGEERQVVVKACELTDGEAVGRLMKAIKPQAVVHLAGRNSVEQSWREPAAALAANVQATANVLEGARSSGDCRILVAGSMIKADPARLAEAQHPYGFSKALQSLAAHAWHRWYGLPVMIAEPSNLIGPGISAGLCGKLARWAVAAEEIGAASHPPFRLSSLGETRDFLDVRDAVDAYSLLIDGGEAGATYSIESGEMRSLGEVKEAFDAEAVVQLLWDIGNAPRDASPERRDTAPIRALGWRPRIPFRQSIRDAMADERHRRSGERG